MFPGSTRSSQPLSPRLQCSNFRPAWRQVSRHFDGFKDRAFPRAMLANPFRHATQAVSQSGFFALTKNPPCLGVVREGNLHFVAGVEMLHIAALAHALRHHASKIV